MLTRGKDVMRGTHLTYNLVTGQAQLGAQGAPGDAQVFLADPADGGRVQGAFTPTPSATGGK